MVGIYPEQENTARKVLDVYLQGKNYTTLVAPMQSGKTGVYCLVGRRGIDMGLWKRVFIICPIGDNALKFQTKKRFQEFHLEGEVLFLGELVRIVNMDRLSFLRQYSNALYIIDESHLGSEIDQCLDKFLQLAGIGGNGDIDRTVYTEGRTISTPYVLSVSATPYAEQSCLDKSKKETIYHIPGSSYMGILELAKNRRFQNIPEEHECRQALEQEIKYLARERPNTYAIIRWGSTGTKSHGYIDEVRNQNPRLRWIQYDQGSNKDTFLVDLLSRRPSVFTIILVKNYCTVGQTFSKRYISMVWETRKNSDTQAQGLPGRCCGYPSQEEISSLKDIHIWCNTPLLTDHLRFENCIRDLPRHIKLNIPTSGNNLELNKKPSHKLGIEKSNQILRIYQTREEMESDIANVISEMENKSYFHGKVCWYKSFPSFSLKKGHVVTKIDDPNIRDEKGCIRQYLPVTESDTRAWSVDFLVSFLLHEYPLLACKKVDYLDEKGRKWKSGKVAKIAYENINDPSTIRYIVYAYSGPVWKMSLKEQKIYGVATDKSMYRHPPIPNNTYKSYLTIQIPDGCSEEEIIQTYSPLVNNLTPVIFMTESESQDIELRTQLQDECVSESYQYLRWAGRCTPSLSCLQPYIDQRLRSATGISFQLQIDAITYFLRTLGATSEDRAIQSSDIYSLPEYGEWTKKWKSDIRTVMNKFARDGLISRIEKPFRYYI